MHRFMFRWDIMLKKIPNNRFISALFLLFITAVLVTTTWPAMIAAVEAEPAPQVTVPHETGNLTETVQPPAPDRPTQDSQAHSEQEVEPQQDRDEARSHNAAEVKFEGQSRQLQLFWEKHRDILPWDYAYVEDIPCPVYRKPLESTEGVRPVRMLDGGPGTFQWVSLQEPDVIKAGNLEWYCINPNEYVETRHLKKFYASDFHGIDLRQHPLDGRYGWIVFDAYTSKKPGKEEFFDGKLLKKHTLVHILETIRINGWDWHKLGPDEWVEQRRVALIKKTPRPADIPANAKWIDINLYEQTIAAYEGDEMVYVSLISSGLPEYETQQGLFRIWAKVKFAKMSGGEKGVNFYYLEDVPYHMYFFNGYAIHGAYWHDNFGIKQSHGCVNISCMDAKWFFDWTLPKAPDDKWVVDKKSKKATYVWVHD